MVLRGDWSSTRPICFVTHVEAGSAPCELSSLYQIDAKTKQFWFKKGLVGLMFGVMGRRTGQGEVGCWRLGLAVHWV